MDTRSVLEAEQELFVARLEQLQSEIQYQRALLELQMITGSLLQLRNLEMSFDELEYSTRRWMDGGTKTIGLNYQMARFDRLPAELPMEFTGDPVSTPWFGVNWGEWETKLEYTPEEQEINQPTDHENPDFYRRFSAGSK